MRKIDDQFCQQYPTSGFRNAQIFRKIKTVYFPSRVFLFALSKKNHTFGSTSEMSTEQHLKKQKTLCNDDLWLACQNDDIDVVKKAIEQKLDLNAKMHGIAAPLYIACGFNYVSIVRLLVETETVDVNTENLGRTPLYVACETGNLEIVNILLNHKNIDIDRSYIDTPLQVACDAGNFEIVKALIFHSANPDKSYGGTTPLHKACLYGNLEIAELLIQNAKNLNQTDSYGRTPLSLLCETMSPFFDPQTAARHLNTIKALSKKLPARIIVQNMHSLPLVDAILLKRLNKDFWPYMKLLLFGQQQRDSPLSELHRDLLQDISKTIKEKLFL